MLRKNEQLSEILLLSLDIGLSRKATVLVSLTQPRATGEGSIN